MNTKAKIKFVFIAFLLLIASSCKESSNILLLDPVGTLVNYSGCKSTNENSGISGKNYIANIWPDPNNDCIEYHYSSDNSLLINHINAGFNCCPGKIVANIIIKDNIITIKENETKPECSCLCLFDVTYQITGLRPGIYKIKIIGLCLNEQDEKLEFTVDLSSPSSGSYCIHRNHYPWGK